MTASDTISAASHNSVFQATGNGVDTPANDCALVEIIEYAAKTAGTTRRALDIKTEWESAEPTHFFDRLDAAGYAKLPGDSTRQMAVLTSQSEVLARERR